MTYSVKEIFLTLQGEGGQAGKAAVFCRFAGCNLWSGREADRATATCRFCDTDFVGTDGTLGGRYDSADLAAAIAGQWTGGAADRYTILTGGEPLVRRNVMGLVRSLSRHLASGALNELTVTTNATQLVKYAAELADCGVRRINVSLDTLDAEKFRTVTRWGDLDRAGIQAAQIAGLKVKINAVALKSTNEDDIPTLMRWAHGRGMDLTLIEVMPMGEIGEGRIDQYLPLSLLRSRLAQKYTMTDLDETTGGPARYVRVAETGGTIGFITPMTHNFCESCNRVRVTCTGMLYMCLGQNDAADLRAVLRQSDDDAVLSSAIDEAIRRKPKGHDFIIDRQNNRPAVARHMSVTGG